MRWLWAGCRGVARRCWRAGTGSGKTVFGLQFLASGAREFGEPGVLVTFAERPDDLIANSESFGWDLDGLVE